MNYAVTLSHLRLGAAAAAILVLTGCATTASNPQDPLEGYNRAMFSFNDAVDRAVLKPVATGYKNVVPGFAQTGVGNFFGNLSDAWSSVNNLLQGKPEQAGTDFGRVALNSTFGIFGLLDIASEAGMQKSDEDFGQTLGKWGVPSGPYLILPLLGPSTVRDTAALPADVAGDIWKYKEPHNWRNINWRNIGCPRQPARRVQPARRRRTRPLRVPARRLPAAPPESGVRRRRAAPGP